MGGRDQEGEVKPGPPWGMWGQGDMSFFSSTVPSVLAVCPQEALGARSWPSSQSLRLLR